MHIDIVRSRKKCRFSNINFRETKKMVEHCLRTAKKQHFSTKFHDCKGDSGATWKVVEDMVPGLRNKNKNAPFDDPLKRLMNSTNTLPA